MVRLLPDWMAPSLADALFCELRGEQIPWTQGTTVLFGEERHEPRLTAWFGESDYTYSGRTMRAAAWPACLAALRPLVDRAAGCSFNAVLLNLYRDGRDSMGMHSDDEPELGRDPVVASLSLGQPRTFVLQPKKNPRASEALTRWNSATAASSSCPAAASTTTAMVSRSSPRGAASAST